VKGQNFTVKVNGFQFIRVLHVHPTHTSGYKIFSQFHIYPKQTQPK